LVPGSPSTRAHWNGTSSPSQVSSILLSAYWRNPSRSGLRTVLGLGDICQTTLSEVGTNIRTRNAISETRNTDKRRESRCSCVVIDANCRIASRPLSSDNRAHGCRGTHLSSSYCGDQAALLRPGTTPGSLPVGPHETARPKRTGQRRSRRSTLRRAA
jgi:hypothetical protein